MDRAYHLGEPVMRAVLRVIFIAALVGLSSPAFAKAHHVAVGTTVAQSGHGLPAGEANTALLVVDLLGPKYCDLPFDQKAVQAVWKLNAKALGVSLANFSAEMKDRLREFEVYWTGDLTKKCKDATKYGKDMGYLPATYRWSSPKAQGAH
jgi:hypothetical protein